MTHTPPYEVLDLTRRHVKAGCEALAEKVQTLRKCRLHVFGHIHEAYGAIVTKRKVGETEVDFVSVNAAMPDAVQAIIVDLRKEP